MKYYHLTGLMLLSVAFLSACATGLSKREYYQAIKSVELGMSKVEFNRLFPEALPRGAKQYSGGPVEVMEVSYGEYSFFPSGKDRDRNGLSGVETQAQWFYFYKNKLIQYGNPGDWPANPDIIIENRDR